MLQNHCVLQCSVARGCLSEAFGSIKNVAKPLCFIVFCCPALSVRDLWINAQVLQTPCVLQYSVACGCLSEAFGSKQKGCKTIVLYCVLLPRGACLRPLEQSKTVTKPLCFTVFCCPGSSVRGLWINAKMLQSHCLLQYSAGQCCLSEAC